MDRTEIIRRVQAGESVIVGKAVFAKPGTLKRGYSVMGADRLAVIKGDLAATITRVQGVKNFDGVEVEGAEIAWVRILTPENASRRRCEHSETSNTGTCYECGKYIAADDIANRL